MHVSVEPSILYFGTPVVLVSTRNEDTTDNLAPNSSVFWLGWRAFLGMAALSKSAHNLARTGHCVLNLASVEQANAVNRLALTTGLTPVPAFKQDRGYRYEPDKFGAAGVQAMDSETVASRRVKECPVQMECVLEATHRVADADERLRGHVLCFELRVQRVHVEESLRYAGDPDRVDPDKWRPLIMSFQRFYGLGSEIDGSRLASIPERAYRSPDVDRARAAPLVGSA
jgi:flavin reductase (DIM6/NTAB) family NADH-FMN oxidoreductase RutF